MSADGQVDSAAAEPARPPLSALELFGLCGFAVAAPLFDLLGRSAEFFVAHGGGAGPVAAVAFGLITLPALACIALHRLISLLGQRAASVSGLAWIGLLVGLTVWIPLKRNERVDEGLAIALAVAAAGAGLAL